MFFFFNKDRAISLVGFSVSSVMLFTVMESYLSSSTLYKMSPSYGTFFTLALEKAPKKSFAGRQYPWYSTRCV